MQIYNGVFSNIEENPSLIYTSETAKKMSELPAFKNLKYLSILQNSDLFDPTDFCDFIKVRIWFIPKLKSEKVFRKTIQALIIW